jgi:hypothetical protein
MRQDTQANAPLARARGAIARALGDPNLAMTPRQTAQYQFSTATSKPVDAVLDGIASIRLPEDLSVTERGSTYLVIGPRPSNYDARLAVGLAILVALAVLIATAFLVVLAALLPLAAVPLIPLLVRDHPLLAVGAVPDDDGISTRVTVHGEAPVRLTSALDLFLSSLPLAEAPPPPDLSDPGTNDRNGSRTAHDEPVRAPEATTAAE